MDDKAHIYQFDNVQVEAAGFRVWKADAPVQIEPKAFQVLVFLIENRGRLIEKREILDAVWKETFVTENALTREIAQLRKALGETAREAKYIETVPTKGYRFIADVRIKNGREASEEAQNEKSAAPENAAGPQESAGLLPSPTGVSAIEGREAKRAAVSKSPVIFVLLGALALLIIGGIFLWKYLRQPATETTSVRRITQVTAWPGLDIYPSLSPDGNSLAYSSNHEGNFEIYVKPLASGGHEVRVTSDGEQNSQPAWSPDGQYIAYHSRNRGGIWIVPSLGGSTRRLTEFGAKPAWSRDGSMIAFQSEAPSDLSSNSYGALPPSTIWTVPSRGGPATQLTRVGAPVGGHSSPSWSPDGKQIVFLSYDTSLAEVWSISAQGGELKRLTTQQLFFDPIYAPDGETIYCVGISRNMYGLWKIKVGAENGERAGEAVEVQSAGPQPIRNLTISADGKKIAYSARSMTSDIWSVPLSPASSEAAGQPVPLLQDRSARKTNPVISPDGKRIAVGIFRSGTPGSIWLMDGNGKNLSQLTTSTSSSTLPGWLSSDEVAYITYREDNATYNSTNLKTGVERTLLPLMPEMDFARLSPDGKQLAYNSGKSGIINLWKVALDGSAPRQLTFDKELMGWASWSPDGRLLAFEMKRGDDTHIAVMPSDGGEVTQLTFERGQSWPHSWSPDGEKIAYAGFRNGVWNIWWVSVKDKTQKQLTGFNKLSAYVRYPAWSPLGNQIVFEYAEMTGNVWMMELK
jgi:Tol biopolymer transport system component/DNA-binding winged helix-turn-helix (wHTH) protein